MSREDAKLLLPIIQAYVEGKNIQTRRSDGNWRDVNDPEFALAVKNYRIKPEPREYWIWIQFHNGVEIYKCVLCSQAEVNKAKENAKNNKVEYKIIHVREVL